MRRFLILIFLCSASVVSAQEQGTQQIDNLDQLLQSVRQEQERQRSINKQRETAFLADKRAQQRLLAEAQREFEQQQKQNCLR